MTNKYKIGDRVACKEVVGKERMMYSQGIIIDINDHSYLIEFDEEIKGHGKSNREWFANEEDLTIVGKGIQGLSGEEEQLALKEVGKHD